MWLNCFIWFKIVLSLWSVAYKHKFMENFLEKSTHNGIVEWWTNDSPLKIFVALFIPFYAFQLQQLYCWMQIVYNASESHGPSKTGQIHPAMEKPRETQWKELLSGNFPERHHSGGESFVQQTFSLKPLDMTKTEWKVLPFFPLSDTVHLVGTTLFPVSPPVLQLQPWGSQTFSNYWTESLVPGGSWVARPHMEISQPKHIKERDVLFHREESISLGLSIYSAARHVFRTRMLMKGNTSKHLPLQHSLRYSCAGRVLPPVWTDTWDLMESSTPSHEIQTASENAAQSQLAETYFKKIVRNCYKIVRKWRRLNLCNRHILGMIREQIFNKMVRNSSTVLSAVIRKL